MYWANKVTHSEANTGTVSRWARKPPGASAIPALQICKKDSQKLKDCKDRLDPNQSLTELWDARIKTRSPKPDKETKYSEVLDLQC